MNLFFWKKVFVKKKFFGEECVLVKQGFSIPIFLVKLFVWWKKFFGEIFFGQQFSSEEEEEFFLIVGEKKIVNQFCWWFLFDRKSYEKKTWYKVSVHKKIDENSFISGGKSFLVTPVSNVTTVTTVTFVTIVTTVTTFTTIS